jgi:hemoglobin
MNPLPLLAVKTNPHFDRLGGAPAVLRLVDAFYGAMDRRRDARLIRAMHGADLADTKSVLVKYLTEWLGGPKLYSQERGPPRLRRVHQPFAVDDDARAAWLGCMQQALDEACADADLRPVLLAAFTKIADHVRNT